MRVFKQRVVASKMALFWLLILVFFYMFSTLKVSDGLDTILSGQSIYRNESLVSKGGKFELGFFSPVNSTNYYLGIWYSNIPEFTVVWVANRETPIHHFANNSRLVLSEDGTLILFNDLKEEIWATNSSSGLGSVPNKGVLLDTGNFVLSDGLSMVWQSFDYPTDTWLPGAGLGIDESFVNKRQVLTSWRNLNDPAPGKFSFGMDPRGGGGLELFTWINQSQILWRSGIWNGLKFPSFHNSLTGFRYILSGQAKSFTYNVINGTSVSVRFVITFRGQINQLIWNDSTQSWNVYMSQPAESCQTYAFCGPFGVCDIASAHICACYEGFQPRLLEEWNVANWSSGCIRIKPLQCSNNGFKRLSRISLPANSQSLNLESARICQFACLGNCSCTAYSYNYGGDCLLWTSDLLDTKQLENSQVDLYLRSSEVTLPRGEKKPYVKLAIAVISPLIGISLTCLSFHIWRKKHNKKVLETEETNENLLLINLEISSKQNTDSSNNTTGNTLGEEKKAFNLPHFSFSSISAATNNFSLANKLGEGGFGPVYKGNLIDGHSVAVKRLSKMSGQGLEELRNETVLIAKLQHRNLVRLLGCCIEQDEKILIYEYMSNKSLDCFIFDPRKQHILDWRRRVQIIEGIGQGLLYLHQHSRLRIVHRDLKASNILLDEELNPKISDFGMARIFSGNVLQANTNRIVGTYGYMSPEYAMEGLFSIKSDVFAFGVLLLEILSGKKNTDFRHSDCLSLLGYAWELWINERVLDLIDLNLDIPSSSFLPRRYIHVGLLCVQESPADRPTMSDVLAMFSNEHMELVSPKRPAFISGSRLRSPRDQDQQCSVTKLTASVMDGR